MPYLPLLGLIALLMALATGRLLPRRHKPAVRAGVVTLVLALYWLLLNAYDFVVRVAAWSTFTPSSIALHVVVASALPVTVCAMVIFLAALNLYRR